MKEFTLELVPHKLQFRDNNGEQRKNISIETFWYDFLCILWHFIYPWNIIDKLSTWSTFSGHKMNILITITETIQNSDHAFYVENHPSNEPIFLVQWMSYYYLCGNSLWNSTCTLFRFVSALSSLLQGNIQIYICIDALKTFEVKFANNLVQHLSLWYRRVYERKCRTEKT